MGQRTQRPSDSVPCRCACISSGQSSHHSGTNCRLMLLADPNSESRALRPIARARKRAIGYDPFSQRDGSNIKLLYRGQPHVSLVHLGRCLDVVPSLLALAAGHLYAIVTSPLKCPFASLAEPFEQVLLVRVQLHVRSTGLHPMPGKVKTVQVESGFLANFASWVVQLTRRESFFLQLSFSSPLLIILSPFLLPMSPPPPLFLLQSLQLLLPSNLCL